VQAEIMKGAGMLNSLLLVQGKGMRIAGSRRFNETGFYQAFLYT
jgi:hypothetical protein